MRLYDNQLNWYDFLVPGSQLTPAMQDIGDFLGIGSQRRQQEYNSAEAQKQRDFEERMSNTSYQRAIEDIKNAGLNPSMLYASGGQGASTPNAASASSGIQNSTNLVGQAGQLINAVTNAKSMEKITKASIYHTISKIVKNLV